MADITIGLAEADRRDLLFQIDKTGPVDGAQCRLEPEQALEADALRALDAENEFSDEIALRRLGNGAGSTADRRVGKLKVEAGSFMGGISFDNRMPALLRIPVQAVGGWI